MWSSRPCSTGAAGEALLAKLDEFAAELLRFRAELVALIPGAEGNGLAADEQADALVDKTARPRPNRL
jgi:hypothetical protein